MASHGARGALFQEQAALYARHRPTYPPELFETIWRFVDGSATEPPAASRALAVDVACGTGQASVELAAVYDRVIAIDSSTGQLEHAVQRPNIEYRLCPAEQLGDVVAPGSVDLITVGQALHW